MIVNSVHYNPLRLYTQKHFLAILCFAYFVVVLAKSLSLYSVQVVIDEKLHVRGYIHVDTYH